MTFGRVCFSSTLISFNQNDEADGRSQGGEEKGEILKSEMKETRIATLVVYLFLVRP